jgi:GGDEF domain-containing protein
VGFEDGHRATYSAPICVGPPADRLEGLRTVDRIAGARRFGGITLASGTGDRIARTTLARHRRLSGARRTGEVLLRAADAALYRAKQKGRARSEVATA